MAMPWPSTAAWIAMSSTGKVSPLIGSTSSAAYSAIQIFQSLRLGVVCRRLNCARSAGVAIVRFLSRRGEQTGVMVAGTTSVACHPSGQSGPQPKARS